MYSNGEPYELVMATRVCCFVYSVVLYSLKDRFDLIDLSL